MTLEQQLSQKIFRMKLEQLYAIRNNLPSHLHDTVTLFTQSFEKLYESDYKSVFLIQSAYSKFATDDMNKQLLSDIIQFAEEHDINIRELLLK